MSKLTGRQIAAEGLDGWAYLLGGLQTRIRTKDFATGLSVVNAIGAVAEEMNHHPDLTLRYAHVDVRLTSHDERAVTDRDIRLGRAISAIAAAAGVRLDSSGVSRLELALDTPARESILPFWAAVLATEHLSGPDFGDELRDPADGLPTVWFQDVWQRGTPAALAPRPVGRSRAGAAAHRRGARRGGHAGQRRRRRRASGCSPTPRATGPACAPGRTAADTRRRQEQSAL